MVQPKCCQGAITYACLVTVVVYCVSALENINQNLKRGTNVDLDKFRKDVLSSHNSKRKIHGSSPLKLDPEMNEEAQKLAQKAAKNKKFPSDLAATNEFIGCSSYLTVANGKEVVDAWYNEICGEGFDFDKLEKNEHARSFSQVVWKDSQKIGIGFYTKQMNNGDYCTFAAAIYRPPGNIAGFFKKNIEKGKFNPEYCCKLGKLSPGCKKINKSSERTRRIVERKNWAPPAKKSILPFHFGTRVPHGSQSYYKLPISLFAAPDNAQQYNDGFPAVGQEHLNGVPVAYPGRGLSHGEASIAANTQQKMFENSQSDMYENPEAMASDNNLPFMAAVGASQQMAENIPQQIAENNQVQEWAGVVPQVSRDSPFMQGVPDESNPISVPRINANMRRPKQLLLRIPPEQQRFVGKNNAPVFDSIPPEVAGTPFEDQNLQYTKQEDNVPLRETPLVMAKEASEDKKKLSVKDEIRRQALEEQNNLRRIHGSPDLKLNEQMCQEADEYAYKIASSGKFEHSGTKDGENLFYECKKGDDLPPAGEAIRSWYEEVCPGRSIKRKSSGYNFQRELGTQGAGHFTQMIWRNSTDFGLGLATKRIRPNYFCTYYVGRYRRRGNVISRFRDNVLRGMFADRICTTFSRDGISLLTNIIIGREKFPNPANTSPKIGVPVQSKLIAMQNSPVPVKSTSETSKQFSTNQQHSRASQKQSSASQQKSSASPQQSSASQKQSSASQQQSNASPQQSSASQRQSSASQQQSSGSQQQSSASQPLSSASQKQTSAIQQQSSASQPLSSTSQKQTSAIQQQSRPSQQRSSASQQQLTANQQQLTANQQQLTANQQQSRPSQQHSSFNQLSVGAVKQKSINNKLAEELSHLSRNPDTKNLSTLQKEHRPNVENREVKSTNFNNRPRSADTKNIFRERILQLHNFFRKIHDSPPLTLSDQLSKEALSRSMTIAKEEGTRGLPQDSLSEGENVYTLCHRAGDKLSVIKTFLSWYRQVCRNKFVFARDGVQRGTKKFAQVVWKASRQLGVDFSTIKRSPTTYCTYVVAKYNPGSNTGLTTDNVPQGRFNRKQMCGKLSDIASSALKQEVEMSGNTMGQNYDESDIEINSRYPEPGEQRAEESIMIGEDLGSNPVLQMDGKGKPFGSPNAQISVDHVARDNDDELESLKNLSDSGEKTITQTLAIPGEPLGKLLPKEKAKTQSSKTANSNSSTSESKDASLANHVTMSNQSDQEAKPNVDKTASAQQKASEDSKEDTTEGIIAKFQENALKLYNIFRRFHDSPVLGLDNALSKKADQRLREIVNGEDNSDLTRREGTNTGENFYVDCNSEKKRPTAKKVVENWYEGVCDYNFGHDEAEKSDRVGKFMQMVWRETSRLGLAIRAKRTPEGLHCTYVLAKHYPPRTDNKISDNVLQGSFLKDKMCGGDGIDEVAIRTLGTEDELPLEEAFIDSKTSNELSNKNDSEDKQLLEQVNKPDSPKLQSTTMPGNSSTNEGSGNDTQQGTDESRNGENSSQDINNKAEKQEKNRTKDKDEVMEMAGALTHNTLRKIHNAEPLVLDDEMSKEAKEYAEELSAQLAKKRGTSTDKMLLRHSDTDDGENLAMKCDDNSDLTAEEATQTWYSEQCDKPYNFNEEGPQDHGHFTQVVWKSSKRLGIGRSTFKSPTGKCSVIVARYRPAGNFMRKFRSNVYKGNFNNSVCKKIDSTPRIQGENKESKDVVSPLPSAATLLATQTPEITPLQSPTMTSPPSSSPTAPTQSPTATTQSQTGMTQATIVNNVDEDEDEAEAIQDYKPDNFDRKIDHIIKEVNAKKSKPTDLNAESRHNLAPKRNGNGTNPTENSNVFNSAHKATSSNKYPSTLVYRVHVNFEGSPSEIFEGKVRPSSAPAQTSKVISDEAGPNTTPTRTIKNAPKPYTIRTVTPSSKVSKGTLQVGVSIAKKPAPTTPRSMKSSPIVENKAANKKPASPRPTKGQGIPFDGNAFKNKAFSPTGSPATLTPTNIPSTVSMKASAKQRLRTVTPTMRSVTQVQSDKTTPQNTKSLPEEYPEDEGDAKLSNPSTKERTTSKPTSGDAEEDDKKKHEEEALEGLHVHNKLRSIHGVPLLTLNKVLTVKAERQAKDIVKIGEVSDDSTTLQGIRRQIIKKSNRNSVPDGIGKNVMVECGTKDKELSVTDAVLMWYKEVCKEKNAFTDGKYSGQINHFTQVVWHSTKSLGIGKATLTVDDDVCTVVIALYQPAGNQIPHFMKNVVEGSFSLAHCAPGKLEEVLKISKSNSEKGGVEQQAIKQVEESDEVPNTAQQVQPSPTGKRGSSPPHTKATHVPTTPTKKFVDSIDAMSQLQALQGVPVSRIVPVPRIVEANIDPMNGMNEYELEEINEHNKLRELHGSPPLQLDKGLSERATKMAREVAERRALNRAQIFESDGSGINLYSSCSRMPGNSNLGNKATISWYKEVCNPGYNFDDNEGGRESRHFTQVIWKGSEKFGIGQATIKRGDVRCTYVTAIYKPNGNVKGRYRSNVLRGAFNNSVCRRLFTDYRRRRDNIEGRRNISDRRYRSQSIEETQKMNMLSY